MQWPSSQNEGLKAKILCTLEVQVEQQNPKSLVPAWQADELLRCRNRRADRCPSCAATALRRPGWTEIPYGPQYATVTNIMVPHLQPNNV